MPRGGNHRQEAVIIPHEHDDDTSTPQKPDAGRTPDISELRRKLRKQHSRPRPVGAQSHVRRTLDAPPPPMLRPRSQQAARASTPAEPGLPPLTGPAVRLESAVSGIELAGPLGTGYLIKTPISSLHGFEHVSDAFASELARPEAPSARMLSATAGGEVPVEDIIFMDLETTGLDATPLFLIGTMVWEDGGFVVHQYLARDYSEERAVIALFDEQARQKQLMVSFNGRSFDMPYVRTRAAATGAPFDIRLPHCDLLLEARRAWSSRLPNCRLQTIETHILGRTRHDDLPGRLIPEAYHEFVRTGDARRIIQILEHNVPDLITMAEILLHLPGR